ncbi:MAG: hypothetical protein AAB300_02535 [Nitrospirota bacterium]
MNCQEIRDKILDNLTGTDNPSDPKEISVHIASCADCHAEDIAWRKFSFGIKRVKAKDPGEAFFQDFSARVSQAVKLEQEQMDLARRPRRAARFRLPFFSPSFQMGMAAGCAVLMIAMALFFKNQEGFWMQSARPGETQLVSPIASPRVSPLKQAVSQANLSDSEAIAVLFDLMDDNEEEEISDHLMMAEDI